MRKSYRDKIAALPIIVIFGVLFVISQTIIGIIIHDLNPLLFIQAQTTFSKDVFVDLLAQWQQAGLMSNYAHHFYPDFLHPVWYAVFLCALMAKAMNLNQISPKFNFLLLAPVVAGLLDLVENIFHVLFISDNAAITQPRIFASALSANLKWGLAGISILIIGFLFLRHRFTQ